MDLKEEERQLAVIIISSSNMYADFSLRYLSNLIVSKTNDVQMCLSHYDEQSLLPTCYSEKTNISIAEVRGKKKKKKNLRGVRYKLL